MLLASYLQVACKSLRNQTSCTQLTGPNLLTSYLQATCKLLTSCLQVAAQPNIMHPTQPPHPTMLRLIYSAKRSMLICYLGLRPYFLLYVRPLGGFINCSLYRIGNKTTKFTINSFQIFFNSFR